MPCSDGNYGKSFALEELRKRNTKLAQMLCRVCRLLDTDSNIKTIKNDKELQQWWHLHQIEDAAKNKQ